MSVTTATKSDATTSSQQGMRRGLTLRSFVICCFALFLLGIWVEYEELYNLYGGPLTENAPPTGAIGVILLVLVISALLYAFRRQLRLATAELVFILAALLVAAPLMTQGMWHRLPGLLAAVPHNEDFKSFESLPTMLWPHGKNLVQERFNGENTLAPFTLEKVDQVIPPAATPPVAPPPPAKDVKPAGKDTKPTAAKDAKPAAPAAGAKPAKPAEVKETKPAPPAASAETAKPAAAKAAKLATGTKDTPASTPAPAAKSSVDEKNVARLTWTSEPWPERKLLCPTLVNTQAGQQAILKLTLDAQQYKLVPGENFLFSCLIKTSGNYQPATSSYFVSMQADNEPAHTVILNSSPTAPSFALKQGFVRIGKCPVQIPPTLEKTLTLRIGLTGAGNLTIQNVQFFNSQAIEGLYTGVRVRRASTYALLGPGERDFTLKKPDILFSPQGLWYLVSGYIPLKQWVMPAFSWTLLIGALFLGFMAFNVLLRKQWVDSERFTFPMNILPRQLFTEEEDGEGRPFLALFRNRVMWIGFGLMMVLCVLKGLHFYKPTVPALFYDPIQLSTYVTNPLLKIYLTNAGTISIMFTVIPILMLIETDILFSIWSCFLIFQLTLVFGKQFNWNRFAGYPWEWQQAIGSFVAYAFVALIAARKHLQRIWWHIIGRQPLDDSGEVVSYRAAALMLLVSIAIIIGWGIWTQMGWVASLIFFSLMLVIGFTSSKIRAEAGMPFGYWMPYYSMWFVSAVGGFAIFGSKGMLVATIVSGFMCVSCFFFIAPVQVEMMELGRHFKVRARDIGHGLWLGLLGGIFLGGFVVLCWAYGFGADNMATTWPYSQNWYFNNYRNAEAGIDRTFASNPDLYSVHPEKMLKPENAPLNIIKNPVNIDAKGVAIGIGVTGLLALLRSLFMWFPLHPLGYVLSTTYFIRGGMWFMALLAWLIRLIVLRIGGAHSIRKGLIPFCVGMFLACVVSVMLFDVVGFYLRTIGMTNIYCKIP